ncbi:CrcB protein [Alkalibacillus flavidus]|uniref:Fluoride-specific ion channel FluC n=1 Tax=Alkalibacillus flavidus TaxID=546021 RepID=A0ABV2KUF1_9BACI
MWLNALFVALGGAIGTFFRYSIDVAFANTSTIMVNLIGSFLLGCLTAYTQSNTMPQWLKVGVGVGLLGGFTTMSTFAQNIHRMTLNGAWLLSTSYSFASVIGGIGLAFIGFNVMKRGQDT